MERNTSILLSLTEEERQNSYSDMERFLQILFKNKIYAVPLNDKSFNLQTEQRLYNAFQDASETLEIINPSFERVYFAYGFKNTKYIEAPDLFQVGYDPGYNVYGSPNIFYVYDAKNNIFFYSQAEYIDCSHTDTKITFDIFDIDENLKLIKFNTEGSQERLLLGLKKGVM